MNKQEFEEQVEVHLKEYLDNFEGHILRQTKAQVEKEVMSAFKTINDNRKRDIEGIYKVITDGERMLSKSRKLNNLVNYCFLGWLVLMFVYYGFLVYNQYKAN